MADDDPKGLKNEQGADHDDASRGEAQSPATEPSKSGGEASATHASAVEQIAEGKPAVGRAPDLPLALAGDAEAPPAAWGAPIFRFEAAWTSFEIRMCVAVLLAEILALVFWIVLKGLSTPTTADSSTGLIMRALIGAIIFGTGAYFATKKRPLAVQRIAVLSAIVIGLLFSKLWITVGTAYFANILNWLQDASTLTLIGGLRGLGTRLTVWLAMIGGSLAAASGKHIHIDVVKRFLPDKLQMPATVAAWSAASVLCFTVAWGFIDHVAIESYDSDKDAPASEKLAAIGHHTSLGMFVLRKQVALDLSTLPVVLGGDRYDSWLTNAESNRRLTDAGWENHFTPEQVASLRMPPEIAQDTRMPVVTVPGSTHSGMLKHLLNLVFPFGFIIIGLRFLMRGVLAISGHVRVGIEVDHGDDGPIVPAEPSTTKGES